MTDAARHHHLHAEALAFPLWHVDALRHATTHLTRDTVGVASDPLASLCIHHLRLRADGASLPELTHLRDSAWFPLDARRVSLAHHVVGIATAHLEERGQRVGLRQDHAVTFAQLAERWRWVSLALPADLLIAALSASQSTTPHAEHVELVTTHLARTLAQPCAETHLHVGAGVSFGVLWTGLMRHVTRDFDAATMKKTLAEKFVGVLPFDDSDRFLHLLRSAALARLVMGSFLLHRAQRSLSNFETFCHERLPILASRLSWPWGTRDALRGLRAMLELLRRPQATLPTSHHRPRDLLRAVSGDAPRDTGSPLEDLARGDPLVTGYSRAGHTALPETHFQARALAHLLDEGRDDGPFAVLFWQYQRVRNATFRLLTQEPGTAGLDWFTSFYNRISFFREALPKYEGQEPSWFYALLTQSRDLRLGAIETRTRPDDEVPLMRDTLRGVVRQSRAYARHVGGHPPTEVGLVLHFIKATDYKVAREGRRLHADPGNLRYGARHAVWFEEQWRRASAMVGVLRDYPELLLVMRGVDVANLEPAQPTWVLVPLFERLRRASIAASRALARVLPGWRVPPLRATVHAGEDYLRVLEGVRRMHEAVEFGLLHQGSRFGHGLAVGVDPEDERGVVVKQPCEERLDDLLWELDRYAQGNISCSSARVERVRHEVMRIACDVYEGHRVSGTDVLLRARRLRHSLRALERLRYPLVDPARARDEDDWRLLVAHLTDRGVFVRGRRLVEVRSTPDERATLVEAQRWLRRELASREITIESNPSSNLLIGDLGATSRHPALRLQPIAPDASRDDAVQLSVNTDNPVTFASCLADEFALLYASLIERGVTASDALAWIDRRREDGWRSRFTLEASAEDSNLARLLPEWRQRFDAARSSRSRASVVSGR